MQVTLLKAKLHKVRVTHAELEYEGSCAIDADFLKLSGIRDFEQIQIYNIDNGERFTTYTIVAEAGSGVISINGAAAHKANPGDRIIICAYAGMAEQQAADFKPALIYFDEDNKVTHCSNSIAVQAA